VKGSGNAKGKLTVLEELLKAPCRMEYMVKGAILGCR
jgi:hypothetical protein